MRLERIVACLALGLLLVACAGTSPGNTGKATTENPTAKSDTTQSEASDLSWEETLDEASTELLKVEEGTNWTPHTDFAREIRAHKPELSALIEDANWVIVLEEALEDSLPDNVKKDLRHLHENYAREAPHDTIAKEVNALLPKLNDERLRKELKKLANRSWDRSKQNAHQEEPKQDTMVVIGAKHDSPLQPQSMPTVAPIVKKDTVPADSSVKETESRIDSLATKGRYVEALRVLETVEDQADPNWLRDRRQNLGNRYCEDRRNVAAAAFVEARKTTTSSARVLYLRQSLSALDSCLFQFPDASMAAKVRRNRALVEKELRR